MNYWFRVSMVHNIHRANAVATILLLMEHIVPNVCVSMAFVLPNQPFILNLVTMGAGARHRPNGLGICAIYAMLKTKMEDAKEVVSTITTVNGVTRNVFQTCHMTM